MPTQASVEIELWATDKQLAKYVTEPGMRKLIGKTLALDPARVTDPYPITCEMHFGRSEVTLYARDETTGNDIHIIAGLDVDDERLGMRLAP